MFLDKHLFALHTENLADKVTASAKGSTLELRDEQLWTRIVRILRFVPGETIILFDQHINIKARIEEQTLKSKNKLFITVIAYQTNEALKPELILYQCLPQKPVFEDIVYTATQMGVITIQPLLSTKVQRKWGDQKERDRLASIAFAACEQSKIFTQPQVAQPITFNTMLEKHVSGSTAGHIKEPQNSSVIKIFFDGQGAPLLSLLQKLDKQKSTLEQIMIVIGPEGGLTVQEIEQLKLHGFEAYALTPTVLRAKDAVMAGLGSIRSVI